MGNGGPESVGATAREGQTFAGGSLLARYASFVKLPHTLFALPFALLGVLAASFTWPVRWPLVALVVVAFSSARWAAMGFNRIVDRAYDAANPRTANREIPRGVITVRQATISVAVASGMFITTAWFINPLCFLLSPFALAWILGYSLAKRFTSWPHLWLGVSLAIAPVGGYLAVTGTWSTPWWMLIAIAVGVMTWVAGFDIFYALPDEGFDRSAGLRSAVVALGRASGDPAGQAAPWGDDSGAAAVRHGRRVRLLVLWRGTRRGGDPGVRAPVGEARRPEPPRCGVLYDERGDERDGVSVCPGGPGGALSSESLVGFD